MTTTIFGIAKNDTHASAIMKRLHMAGFRDSDISILFSDQTGSRDLVHEKATKAPEGAAAGAGTGAIIGGALGWIAGIGALAIPGVGPLIAAGPIMAALSGAAVGGTFGGVTGGLMGLGAPEYEAKQYDAKLRQGNILLSVHARTTEQVNEANRILKEEKAEDIASANEETVPRK